MAGAWRAHLFVLGEVPRVHYRETYQSEHAESVMSGGTEGENRSGTLGRSDVQIEVGEARQDSRVSRTLRADGILAVEQQRRRKKSPAQAGIAMGAGPR